MALLVSNSSNPCSCAGAGTSPFSPGRSWASVQALPAGQGFGSAERTIKIPFVVAGRIALQQTGTFYDVLLNIVPVNLGSTPYPQSIVCSAFQQWFLQDRGYYYVFPVSVEVTFTANLNETPIYSESGPCVAS
jgi:hypothetical protein